MNLQSSYVPAGKLTNHEPMSKHTSWRVGGTADRYYQPRDTEDLAAFISQLPATEKITWIGLGSNLLVRDGGIRGTVIATSGVLVDCELVDDQVIRAGSGVPCAKVSKLAAKSGLGGIEFFAGIPGVVGGALAMNAGAFGGETWSLVKQVETLDRQGQRHIRQPQEYDLGYRHVSGPADEWFIAAWFLLDVDESGQGSERIKKLLAKRNNSQPMGQASCGSVFRNPENDYAARLIDSCGLKGRRIGAAEVSTKHANFIINTGQAQAADIEALISMVHDTVEEKTGISLIAEVRIIGENMEVAA